MGGSVVVVRPARKRKMMFARRRGGAEDAESSISRRDGHTPRGHRVGERHVDTICVPPFQKTPRAPRLRANISWMVFCPRRAGSAMNVVFAQSFDTVVDCGETRPFTAIAVAAGRAFIRTAAAPGSPGKRGHMPCASADRLTEAFRPPCASYIQ